MTHDEQYSKRELDAKFDSLETRLFDEQEGYLPRIETQTIKHNGRMTRMERYLLIVACIVATLLVTNSSELLAVFKIVI